MPKKKRTRSNDSLYQTVDNRPTVPQSSLKQCSENIKPIVTKVAKGAAAVYVAAELGALGNGPQKVAHLITKTSGSAVDRLVREGIRLVRDLGR